MRHIFELLHQSSVDVDNSNRKDTEVCAVTEAWEGLTGFSHQKNVYENYSWYIGKWYSCGSCRVSIAVLTAADFSISVNSWSHKKRNVSIG